MQLTLNIKNNTVAKKVLWFLEHLKNEGVEISCIADTESELQQEDYSDEYVKKHWKEIIMSVGSDDTYYKSEQYLIERGDYLAEKYL